MANQYYQRQVTFIPGEFVKAADFEAELNAVLGGFDNVPAKEEGVIVPTFSCETVGDLNVSYSTQLGDFYRLDDLIVFGVQVICTPTFTTAEGSFRIAGLPYASDTNKVTTLHSAQFFGAGVKSWPEGVTTLFGYIEAGDQFVELFGNGFTTESVNREFTMDNIQSGSEINIRVTGTYLR